MIEKKIVSEKFLEYQIKNYIFNRTKDVLIDEIVLEKAPLGEKIVLSTPTPGLVIGAGGSNISAITREIKEKFNLENPRIKISDSGNFNLSASIVARRIANNFRRYGSARFKLVGYKNIGFVLKAGALGVEIILSGKIPSARSKSWRFTGGFIKKTGHTSDFFVDKAIENVTLKTGVIGIKVNIVSPDMPMPQKVSLRDLSSESENVDVSFDEDLADVEAEKEVEAKVVEDDRKEKKSKEVKKE